MENYFANSFNDSIVPFVKGYYVDEDQIYVYFSNSIYDFKTDYSIDLEKLLLEIMKNEAKNMISQKNNIIQDLYESFIIELQEFQKYELFLNNEELFNEDIGITINDLDDYSLTDLQSML